MRSFVKIKSSRNGEIILSFTDIGTCKPCHSRDFYVTNMFLTLFANKIIAKNSESTVLSTYLSFIPLSNVVCLRRVSRLFCSPYPTCNPNVRKVDNQ